MTAEVRKSDFWIAWKIIKVYCLCLINRSWIFVSYFIFGSECSSAVKTTPTSVAVSSDVISPPSSPEGSSTSRLRGSCVHPSGGSELQLIQAVEMLVEEEIVALKPTISHLIPVWKDKPPKTLGGRPLLPFNRSFRFPPSRFTKNRKTTVSAWAT